MHFLLSSGASSGRKSLPWEQPKEQPVINLDPRALLRIEGRLKGTGVKTRSSFDIARSEESYAAKS